MQSVTAIGVSMRESDYPLVGRLNWRSQQNVIMWIARWQIHNPDNPCKL